MQSIWHISDVQELPWMHKVCLWLGIAMDVGAKAGLCMQLRRFALHAHWAWLAVVAAFFAMSSLTSLGWVATCSPSCQDCCMLSKDQLLRYIEAQPDVKTRRVLEHAVLGWVVPH